MMVFLSYIVIGIVKASLSKENLKSGIKLLFPEMDTKPLRWMRKIRFKLPIECNILMIL